MNTFSTSPRPNSFNRIITLVVGFCIAFLALSAVANGQIDGFTEPFRKIDLSSDETGSIAEMLVEEANGVEQKSIKGTAQDYAVNASDLLDA